MAKRKVKQPKKLPYYGWQNPEAANAARERARSGAAGPHSTEPNRRRTKKARNEQAIKESRDND